MVSKAFLKSIENTRQCKDEYVNIVGSSTDLYSFLNECLQEDVWFYRIYTFCVYKGEYIKGIFCKKEDIQTIKQLIKGKDLVLNASNPF